MSELKANAANSKAALELLETQVQTIIQPLGYDLVALEQTSGAARGGRTLVLYIDFASTKETAKTPDGKLLRVGLDDCARVNEAVDELFETTPLVYGAYTLEVSSPGVERPLRRPQDYERFAEHKARLHTFRSLDSSEVGNEAYWTKNQKQKNFVGILKGLTTDQTKVQMEIDGNLVTVPIQMVSKAHLEFMVEEKL